MRKNQLFFNVHDKLISIAYLILLILLWISMVSAYKNCDSSHASNMGISTLSILLKEYLYNSFYRLFSRNRGRYKVASFHGQNCFSKLSNSLGLKDI